MVSRANKFSPNTMALSCSLAKTWVKNNYEKHEEGVVAKSVMYKHYEDHCREEGRNIMETSIFGRVVKSVFPDVNIRRLGGRENLKYYYCGFRAKETSPYAIDNTNTTRPKRRLRKRELVTDKTDVDSCLRWLHAHYTASTDSSVIKTVVYDSYVYYCKSRGAEPLSLQYFGSVVNHAFPNVTKRKLGPRTNQQKYYYGIQERPDPMPPELVPGEYLNIDDVVLRRKTYRETNPLGDEEDEEFCRSPVSDGMPDMTSPQAVAVGFEGEIAPSPHMPAYNNCEFYFKEEPVDYSLQSLRLKDEGGTEDEDIGIKHEPLDLHIGRACERRTPDRPPSTTTTYGSASPSPPVKESKVKRIYKPRFHYDYHVESPWNVEQETKLDSNDPTYFEDVPQSQLELMLENWLRKNVECCKGVHVNRDQLYEYYTKTCSLNSYTFVPLAYFDETILKSFRPTVTNIHPSRKTFYEGIRVCSSSPFFQKIEMYSSEDPDSTWGYEDNTQHSMELSPGDGSEAFPLNVEEEEEEENIEETYAESPYHYPPPEDEIHPTADVLKDGKFYLRKWLMDNFESVADSCVLKAEAYKHYEAYARSINQTPFEMNVFGKIVRQAFPKVSIRRLGGRMKPQYHYCGIAPKQTSLLYPYLSGKDPAQRSRKKEIATDKRSAEIVIEWLKKTYESGKDSVIMKSDVFNKYIHYCSIQRETPVTLNYFGKVVKHCFPSVEVRKLGGRNDPTWCYHGLVARASAYAPHGDISGFHPVDCKEGITGILQQTNAEVSSSGVAHTTMDLGMPMPRQESSPIPIILGRSPAHVPLGTPTGNSFGSPSTILPNVHGVQSPLQITPYVHNSPRNYPLECDHFFRDAPLASHSLVDGERRAIQMRSHFDQAVSSEGIYSSAMDSALSHGLMPMRGGGEGGIYHREQYGLPPHQKFHHQLGGQIVPSQTPPSICTGQGNDQAVAMVVNKRQRKQFSPHQEEYEICDMGME